MVKHQHERGGMTSVSLPAASTLTEWSERTFFRKFADGSVLRSTESGRVMISLDQIMPHLCLPLEPEDIHVLKKADLGDAESQNEVALIFLSNNKFKSAIYWLELASNQNYADSMSFLSQCYMEGNGVQKDKNMAIMWIAKAAAYGHVLAQSQINALEY